MRLKSFLFEYKVTQSLDILQENIAEYFAVVMSKLKNKKPEELFGEKPMIDLDRLAEIVHGMKIIGNKEYRAAMTKDDVGINPSNMHDLYSLLVSIPKDEKAKVKLVDEVMTALKSIAPSAYERDRKELEALKSSTEDTKRAEIIKKLDSFHSKITKLFTVAKADDTKKKAA